MQHRQEVANNLSALKTWQNSSNGLLRHRKLSRSHVSILSWNVTISSNQVRLKAKYLQQCYWWGKIKTMWQNRHCQIYRQILHPEKNVMRSTVLQERGRKSPLLLVGKTLGFRYSAEADRVMYNKCRHGADSGQKLLMRCGQRAQIFCPRHL